MKVMIPCSENLEVIKQKSNLPSVLTRILSTTTTYQERTETSLLTSLRAKNSFAEWIAALVALNPQANLQDGSKLAFAEVLEKNATSLNDLRELEISLDESDLFAYEKVANTPGDNPIVSVSLYLKFKGEIIEEARITATGASKEPYSLITCAKELIGKGLDSQSIAEIKGKVRKELTPVGNYLGSEDYRKEMTATLIEAILDKKRNGEIK